MEDTERTKNNMLNIEMRLDDIEGFIDDIEDSGFDIESFRYQIGKLWGEYSKLSKSIELKEK